MKKKKLRRKGLNENQKGFSSINGEVSGISINIAIKSDGTHQKMGDWTLCK